MSKIFSRTHVAILYHNKVESLLRWSWVLSEIQETCVIWKQLVLACDISYTHCFEDKKHFLCSHSKKLQEFQQFNTIYLLTRNPMTHISMFTIKTCIVNLRVSVICRSNLCLAILTHNHTRPHSWVVKQLSLTFKNSQTTLTQWLHLDWTSLMCSHKQYTVDAPKKDPFCHVLAKSTVLPRSSCRQSLIRNMSIL